MQTTKMNLANIQGKLSRAEMKNVMGGVEPAPKCKNSGSVCTADDQCCSKGCDKGNDNKSYCAGA